MAMTPKLPPTPAPTAVTLEESEDGGDVEVAGGVEVGFMAEDELSIADKGSVEDGAAEPVVVVLLKIP